jgi:hypothetical protein
MSFLRALRALVLGETWIVPLGVAVLLGAAAMLRSVAAHAWHDAGAAVLAAGVVAVLVAAVARGARAS